MATAILKKRVIERNNLPRINACSSAERLQGADEGLMGTWIDGTGCRTQEGPCKHTPEFARELMEQKAEHRKTHVNTSPGFAHGLMGQDSEHRKTHVNMPPRFAQGLMGQDAEHRKIHVNMTPGFLLLL